MPVDKDGICVCDVCKEQIYPKLEEVYHEGKWWCNFACSLLDTTFNRDCETPVGHSRPQGPPTN